ncbi:MAG: 50S ribosomal protein L4 [Candidatus Roizmanbacteria bacterium]
MNTKVEKITSTIKKIVKENTGVVSINIYDISGKVVSEMEMPVEIFSVIVNESLLTQAIRVYQVNQRQGNASTKTRGEVVGSSRKIYKQKGTGNARHGNIRAPIFVGGGITGGPRSKDFELKMNKKQKVHALLTALTIKAQSNCIIGLDKSVLTMKPKTKEVGQFMKSVDLNKSVLFVIPEAKQTGFYISAKNIPNISVVSANQINPYDIMKYSKIVLIEGSVNAISSHFLNK